MTTEQSTGTELVRFTVTDKTGAQVEAAVPAELAERFPTLGNADEMAELIEEVFGEQGGSVSFGDLVRVTVPDGKSVAFTVGDEAVKTITGIILVRQERRNYWEKSIEDSGGGQAPDCTSRDGVTGEGAYGPGSEENPSGVCLDCPMSQWHEGADGKRIPPPCKQQELLLLLVGDSALPYIVSVPRTSITPFRNYWKRNLFARLMKSPLEVVTVIGLKKVANENSVDYNELTFTMSEDITKGMTREAKVSYKTGLLGLAAQFREILKSVDVTQDEEERPARTSGDPDDEGGYSMGAPVDDDLVDAYANAGTGSQE